MPAVEEGAGVTSPWGRRRCVTVSIAGVQCRILLHYEFTH
jgi:hypothetical protein